MYDDSYGDDKPKRGHGNRKRRLPFILLTAVGVCGVLVCVSAIAYLLVETITVRSRYGAELAGMCDPPTGGEASRDNFPFEADGVKFLILDEGLQMRDLWQGDLPDDWKAETADEVDIVMCFDDAWVARTACPLADGGSREREQHVVELVLLNADNGRRIADVTFEGSLPGCPQDDDTSRLRGDEVTVNEFVIWFEDF